MSNTERFEKMNFGMRIREQRINLGLTLSDVAERCDMSEKNLHNIEHGRTEPKVGTAILLCRACEIPYADLSNFTPVVDVCNKEEKGKKKKKKSI